MKSHMLCTSRFSRAPRLQSLTARCPGPVPPAPCALCPSDWPQAYPPKCYARRHWFRRSPRPPRRTKACCVRRHQAQPALRVTGERKGRHETEHHLDAEVGHAKFLQQFDQVWWYRSATLLIGGSRSVTSVLKKVAPSPADRRGDGPDADQDTGPPDWVDMARPAAGMSMCGRGGILLVTRRCPGAGRAAGPACKRWPPGCARSWGRRRGAGPWLGLCGIMSAP